MTNFLCQLFEFFCKKINLTVVRQSSDTCQAVFRHSSRSCLVVHGQLSDSRQAVLRQLFDRFFFVFDVNYLNFFSLCQLFELFCKKVNLTVVRQSSDTCQEVFRHSFGSRRTAIRQSSGSS